jgi:hypothetical protein
VGARIDKYLCSIYAGEVMQKENLSKLDVAKRQMNEAIRLFFESRDTVSIHTLAAAANQVLTDLCNSQGVGTPMRDGKRIKESRRKEWRKAMKAAENFFKHADHDPDRMYGFNAKLTEFVLLDSAVMYSALTGRGTYEAIVFQSWYFLKYPDTLLDSNLKTTLMENAVHLNVSPDDFDLFRDLLKNRHLLSPNAAVHVD